MVNQSATTLLLRKPAVLAARGKSNSQLYRDIQSGLFTKPVEIGPNSSAWPSYEVEAINRAVIAGKSDEEIRKLVSELHLKRKEGA
ncbi:MAG TPA: AlpA family phage regulatory protein [Methylococcaceae bacterium]|nr:AlpA family phage regulatory protein [Methylococcaceae bacterium]